MDRRSLMTMAVLTLAAPSAVLARHRAARSRSDEGEATHGEASPADVKYAQQTLAIGAVALATSQLAQSMSKDDWVKRFANYEVAEQTTVAEVLKSLGMKPENSDQPAEMANKLKSSKNFDTDYLAAQLDGHQQLLKIQDDYIGVAKDPAHLGLAKLARTQIKEHIDLIQTIQKNLKT
jgi:putative membrane protein